MRAAFLGPEGTFSHEALLAFAGADRLEPVPLPTVHEAIVAVEDGAVDVGLVPIENSLEGGVGATLDTLATDTDVVEIVGELLHRVRHCVIAPAPLELPAVRSVVSHPQATAQCRRFLRTQLPGAAVVAASSTAEAVRMVAEGRAPEVPAVALGTGLAARLYGCDVLREGVEDVSDNVTRFVWLARPGTRLPSQAAEEGSWKTTVVWWGDGDESPGWLVRCLSEFAFRGVNLTRIESRPRRLGLGHYMFFADVDGRSEEAPVADALAALAGQAATVRVLGSYPAAG